jgi:DNA adenine methylase
MIAIKTENNQSPRFLRYPGGKGRLMPVLSPYLPKAENIKGKYIDPFVGGASVFFYLRPTQSLLSDLNEELMSLYSTLRDFPSETWEEYCKMPNTKEGYYEIRALSPKDLDFIRRAARLLYLNRTCFKGMWRQNKQGEFNIGYGGQSRRWVVTENALIEVAERLKTTDLMCSDFEEILDLARTKDFVFLDPPYRPGSKELQNAHYVGQEFDFKAQQRLAQALSRASRHKIPWIMTNSSHPDICSLYEGNFVVPMTIGTGNMPGLMSNKGGEAIIYNKYAASYFRFPSHLS